MFTSNNVREYGGEQDDGGRAALLEWFGGIEPRQLPPAGAEDHPADKVLENLELDHAAGVVRDPQFSDLVKLSALDEQREELFGRRGGLFDAASELYGLDHSLPDVPILSRAGKVLRQLLQPRMSLKDRRRVRSEVRRIVADLHPLAMRWESLVELGGGSFEISADSVDPATNRQVTEIMRFGADGYLEETLPSSPGVRSLTREREIAQVLNELQRERECPGTGDVREATCITDFHGAYRRLVMLLADVFGIEGAEDLPVSAKKMQQTDVYRRLLKLLTDRSGEVNEHDGTIYLGGDITDRACCSLETFRLVRVVMSTGLARYVTGNHDLWTFMNLQGMHLPFYKGYKGVDSGYVSEVHRDDVPRSYVAAGYPMEKVEDDSKLVRINVILFHNEKLQEVPDAQMRSYWAKHLNCFMQEKNADQNKRWKEVKARMLCLFQQLYGDKVEFKKLVSPSLVLCADCAELDEELREWWGRVGGFPPAIGVATYQGVNAVGKMSVGWWEARLAELERFQAECRTMQDSSTWIAVKQLLEEILAAVRADLRKEVRQHHWWHAVIDGIMARNYTSAEWWALDWIFHGAEKSSRDIAKGKAWGPSTLWERTIELDPKASPADWNLYTDPRINTESYLSDTWFRTMAMFFQEHFSLYHRDLYGNVYMHSFVPTVECVLEDGSPGIKAGFEYKGVFYEGERFFEGLDRVQNDVRDSSMAISERRDALELVNSWYADETTCMKPVHLVRCVQFGLSRILDPIGVTRLIIGHNTLEKLGKYGIGFNMEDRVFCVDNDMSEQYRDMGGRFVCLGRPSRFQEGIYMRGFAEGEKKLEDSPVITDRGGKPFVVKLGLGVAPVYKGVERKRLLVSLGAELAREGKALVEIEPVQG